MIPAVLHHVDSQIAQRTIRVLANATYVCPLFSIPARGVHLIADAAGTLAEFEMGEIEVLPVNFAIAADWDIFRRQIWSAEREEFEFLLMR